MVLSLLGSFGTSVDSVVKQKMSLLSDLKDAAKEDKSLKIEKRDVFPTSSSGSNLEPPKLEYYNQVSDYYRNGKFYSNGNLENFPRTLEMTDGTVKEDIASIRVYGKPSGQKEYSDLIPAYTKFILDGVQETHTERSQIIETFGDFYVFMFGERPPMYNFTGSLINGRNTNWLTDFMFMYDQYLRGTRCVENNAVAIMTYGGRQVEGLILNTSNQTMAATEGGVPFQFSLVVFNRSYFTFSEDMGYSIDTGSGTIIQDPNLLKLLDQVAGKTGVGTSTSENSGAFKNTKDVMSGATSAFGRSSIMVA